MRSRRTSLCATGAIATAVAEPGTKMMAKPGMKAASGNRMSNEPVILTPPQGYAEWLAELKARIHTAQQRATLAVNRELVLLYWNIGRDVLARQAEQGWGAKVIDRLAKDLRAAFPEMKGFSPRNLKYMRAFADAWPEGEFVQAVLAQLPWYHQLALLDKLPSPEARRWYAAKAIEHNWSRNVLVMQIETQLLERTGQAVTNFPGTLPAPQSDRESIKDPYRFDFLGLLRLRGHEARVAYGGDEALAACERRLPDVVVMDIGMPGRDGHATAREIAARWAGPSLPTMAALTGWGQPEDRRKSAEAGFHSHFTKPADFDKLMVALGL